MSLRINDPFKDMKQECVPVVTEEIIPTDQSPPHLPQTVTLSPALSPIFPHQESCHSAQTQMLAVKTLSRLLTCLLTSVLETSPHLQTSWAASLSWTLTAIYICTVCHISEGLNLCQYGCRHLTSCMESNANANYHPIQATIPLCSLE